MSCMMRGGGAGGVLGHMLRWTTYGYYVHRKREVGRELGYVCEKIGGVSNARFIAFGRVHCSKSHTDKRKPKHEKGEQLHDSRADGVIHAHVVKAREKLFIICLTSVF